MSLVTPREEPLGHDTPKGVPKCPPVTRARAKGKLRVVLRGGPEVLLSFVPRGGGCWQVGGAEGFPSVLVPKRKGM